MRKRWDDIYRFMTKTHCNDTKVIELDSFSFLGYNLKHAALHGAQRYDEAIQAFQMMLSKLDDAPDIQTRGKRLITPLPHA